MNTLLKSLIVLKFGTNLALAQKMGMTEMQVSQTIHGRRSKPQERRKMAKLLDIEEDKLFPKAKVAANS